MNQSKAAMEVISQALAHEHSPEHSQKARSFLERTCSIYVLDVATNTTYGGWDLLHQAFNEVDRLESQDHGETSSIVLVPPLRLLATIALKLARRSDRQDQQLLSTCLQNAAQYHGSTEDQLLLLNRNQELRDIVIGRIAAICFDERFHNMPEEQNITKSSLRDTLVMETLCATLSANAISNSKIRPFLVEWILPSASSMPPLALSCVILRLAREAQSPSTPAGIQESLQTLSGPVVSGILTPILQNSLSSEGSQEDTANSTRHRLATTTLLALRQWCQATDLSLAQIKHCGSKHNVSKKPNHLLTYDYLFLLSRFLIFIFLSLVERDRYAERRHVQWLERGGGCPGGLFGVSSLFY